MKRRVATVAISIALGAVAVFAQEAPDPEAARRDFEASLTYQEGEVALSGGLATLHLDSSFRYLDPKQSRRVLEDAWGNPPGAKTLGMLFPAGVSPVDEDSWGVVISYEEDGYVDDEGAEKIDFDELLADMQQAARDENEEREKQGYETVELVGWAEPPRYDQAAHKLYWAKDLRFAGSAADTLNYNIRVLGRRGVLVLNAVASLDRLPQVKDGMQGLLPAIEFNPGHRYADFVPGKDKVAKYGIGALIIGSLAAKTGLFKALLAGILAFKKLILVGLVGGGAALRALFKRKQANAEGPITPG